VVASSCYEDRIQFCDASIQIGRHQGRAGLPVLNVQTIAFPLVCCRPTGCATPRLILLARRPYSGLLCCALGLLLLALVFCALTLYFRPYATVCRQCNLRTGNLGNSQNTLPSGCYFVNPSGLVVD
jgi:hypothetical protein